MRQDTTDAGDPSKCHYMYMYNVYLGQDFSPFKHKSHEARSQLKEPLNYNITLRAQ